MARTAQPFVSIVVPTYDRPKELAVCLEALAALDYPADSLEVVVVDDGGAVPLDALAEEVAGNLELRVVRIDNSGPAAARNEGSRNAKGDLLAFTDDDCRPDPSWLRTLVTRWDGTSQLGLGGHTVNVLTENLYSATSQLIVDVGYGHSNSGPEGARFLTSNNLVVPAEGFWAVGGFDPAFVTSEDRDFCDRWVARGFSLAYVPEAIVHHAHELTMMKFIRQQFAYGRGAARYHRAHANRWNRRVTIEPSFYIKLFLSPIRRKGGRRVFAQSLLLQLWNFVNLGGFLYERGQARAARKPHRGN